MRRATRGALGDLLGGAAPAAASAPSDAPDAAGLRPPERDTFGGGALLKLPGSAAARLLPEVDSAATEAPAAGDDGSSAAAASSRAFLPKLRGLGLCAPLLNMLDPLSTLNVVVGGAGSTGSPRRRMFIVSLKVGPRMCNRTADNLSDSAPGTGGSSSHAHSSSPSTHSCSSRVIPSNHTDMPCAGAYVVTVPT